MKTKEIFEATVKVMKDLLTQAGMREAIGRIRGRSDEEIRSLLDERREEINEVVRKVAERGGAAETLEGTTQELRDALVVRYLRNREVFLKTFPGGIEEIDADPVSLWAAMMISPSDEKPETGG